MAMIEVISSFRGEYSFLSNYDTAPFIWRGNEFKSATQAIEYAQSLVPNTPDWDKRKVHYMREIIHAKFQGVKGYAGKLINTSTSPLINGNDLDTFWGRCRVDDKIVGLNMLGVILMECRGYWLWGRQDCGHVVGSDLLTVEQMERIADYG